MDQYFGSSETYGYGYDYPTEQQGQPEWVASPSSSVSMSRLPSADSIVSTFSMDQVETPCSEYNFDQMWFHVDETGRHIADYSQGGVDMTSMSEPVSDHYIMGTGCYSHPNGFQSNLWPQHMAENELMTEPAASSETPVHEDYSTEAVPRSHTSPYRCEMEGCTKAFKRKADRDRHHLQVHTPVEMKEKYPCDWKKCQRAQEPFGRTDHQRDHFRDFHLEDVMWRRPSNKNNKNFWETRKVNISWWRCSRCLERVSYADHQYECPSCQGSCEIERQRYRSHIAAVAAQGGSYSG